MRYFLGFLVTVGLIIVLILMVFKGGDKTKVTTTSKPLDSYSTTDASVSMTIDGPVNANSNHQQVRVSVDRNNVSFEQINGYDGSVVKQQSFPNTQSAYATFLLALSKAGFTKGDTSSALKDERGYCALGDRYIFELQQGTNDLQRFWVTSCGGVKTYEGSRVLTVDLFEAQVPNYDQLALNVVL